MLNLSWKTIIAILAAWFLSGWLTGCGNADRGQGVQVQEVVEGMRRAGVKGRIRVMTGDGHFLGQAFNFLGTHLYAEGEFDPIDEQHPEAFDTLPVPTSGPAK